MDLIVQLVPLVFLIVVTSLVLFKRRSDHFDADKAGGIDRNFDGKQ
ncbi:hypothetical protein [Sulfuricurvum sp. IAE1]|nr:hypothetical protein [Sulfuricurvum sp. IAE1]